MPNELFPILSDLFPVIVCSIAVGWDLRTREIPDTLSLVLMAGTLVAIGLGDWSHWWRHLLGGVAGLLAAALVSQGDRFGGGDVKLFASLCTWFGIFAVVPLALWIAIAGLPLSVVAALRKQEDLAYAPAIFIGVCVHVLWPDLFLRIAGL
ncbi:MAG: A24 family peptidase [Planctomycetota bacterium]